MVAALLATMLSTTSIATPLPQTTAQPLKVIVTVKSSTYCSALRSLAIPVGYVTHRNEDAFQAVSADVVQYWGIGGAAGPRAYTEALRRRQQKNAPVSEWSQNTAVIHAKNAVHAIDANLDTERHLMSASLKQYPQGTDKDVDALRRRLQNLIELQTAMVNRVEFPQATYAPAPNLECVAPMSFAPYPCEVTKSTGGPPKTFTIADNDPWNLANASVSDVARNGGALVVRKALTFEEIAFANEVTVGGKSCGL